MLKPKLKNRKINLDDVSCKGFALDKQRQQQVTVMIPKHTFFQIHPDNKINAAVAYHEGKWYLFDFDVANHYYGKLQKLAKATLYQGITDAGQSFILPVVEPWPGYPITWHDSLLCRVEKAKTHAMKIESDTRINCYAMVEEKRLSKTPNWPADDFATLLTSAFPDECYVEYDDHPLIDALYIG